MMLTEELKIPTGGRDIEAFAMYREARPAKAFLILPGKGYTINHFLLDFLWRMAAECGFFAVKAEYRGYTYRHLGEPYDHEHAARDAEYVLDWLADQGYPPEKIIPCGKSLGTIALGAITAGRDIGFAKAVLLTPVLYYRKGGEVFPAWTAYNKKVRESCLVFGGVDPYCDPDTVRQVFPDALVYFYPGADHGLHLAGDYARTIDIQREIIARVRNFITSISPHPQV